jgi:Zn-dependent protease with chaperone function
LQITALSEWVFMDASSYQHFRLWAGICSIGLNLGMIWTAYAFCLLPLPLPGIEQVPYLPLYAMVVTVAIILAYLPFEILIGYAAELAQARTQLTLGQWLRDWWRPQWFVAFGLTAGISLFGIVSQMPLSAIMVTLGMVTLLVLALIWGLPYLIRLPGGLRPQTNPVLEAALNETLREFKAPDVTLKILDDGDEEGVNGVIMPFHPKTLYINRAAAEELDVKELAALTFREQWFHQRGQTLLHVGIVLGWILAGVYLALTVPGSILPATTALEQGLGGAAIMTTWCFLALLIWPPLNNRAMLKADLHLAHHVGAEATIALLNKIQTLNETDFELDPAKEHVFHPIPSLKKRIEALQGRHT